MRQTLSGFDFTHALEIGCGVQVKAPIGCIHQHNVRTPVFRTEAKKKKGIYFLKH
jgi:hypothetical protein